MIAVKIYWNTEADGSLVDPSIDIEEGPMSFYGPFASITDAISWMENDYPDGDTDVHDIVADDFDVPSDWLNAPDSIFGDIPDEDIRD